MTSPDSKSLFNKFPAGSWDFLFQFQQMLHLWLNWPFIYFCMNQIFCFDQCFDIENCYLMDLSIPFLTKTMQCHFGILCSFLAKINLCQKHAAFLFWRRVFRMAESETEIFCDLDQKNLKRKSYKGARASLKSQKNMKNNI